MINLPYNVPLVSQIMPTQSIPVQTSQNNLQPFHQPQTVAQQMQTSPVAFPGNPQDAYKPFYQLHQSDVVFANHQYIPNQQYITNPLQPRNPYHLIPQTQTTPNPPVAQTQPSCGQLPPSIVEQIRSAVSNTAPIFILPGGCHQSASHQQQPPPVYPSNQGGVSSANGPSTGFNYPPSIYCPPSFVPYPIPFPLYEPFTGLTRAKEKSQVCECCQHRQETTDTRSHLANPFWSHSDSQEHRCALTNDDTVCAKRNCPASVSLQALASQFLSLPGIISCAATRLILRKVHGSNITNTMEETMEKAQKAISMLNKEQLLVESRIAQQVNALINLHVTANIPASIIPLLMLVQAKVNILKALVENLVNRKVMECQGYGFEVETSGPIDPAVLALKSNAELRQLLGALQQKECDERVNANFAAYHSQRTIAESRLHNVRAKIRQVETEFDNRRHVTVPGSTLTSQIIRQFSESRCAFGYAPGKLFEPCVVPDSPDPFSPAIRNPRRLYIKPHQPEPPSTKAEDRTRGTNTAEESPSCKDTGIGEGNAQCDTKDQSVGRRCSRDSCICEESSSEDSLDEDKKKLRPMIERNGDARNIEDGECQESCEISGTAEENDNEVVEATERSGKELLTIEEVEEAEGDHGGLLEADDEDSKVKKRGSKVAEAEKSQGEHNASIKEERVVAQGPEGPSEYKVLEAESTKQEKHSGTVDVEETVAKGPEGPSEYKVLEAESTKQEKHSGTVDVEETVAKGPEGPSEYKVLEAESTKQEKHSGTVDVEETVAQGPEGSHTVANKTKRRGKQQKRKDYANVRVIKANYINELDRMKYRQDENILSDEARPQNRNEENVQIVSMMTAIKYDRSAGDFGRYLATYKCTDKKLEGVEHSMNQEFSADNPENAKNENYTCLLAEKIGSSKVCDMNDQKEHGSGLNSRLGDPTEKQSMFVESPRLRNEKATGEFKRFPPLKQAKSNAKITRISQFVPRQVHPDTATIDDDGGASGHPEASSKNCVASIIHSMIGDRLDYVGSLVDRVPNLQTILSNLYLNKLWSVNGTVPFRRSNMEPNKTAISRKDDWILLPTDIDRITETQTSERDVSVGSKLYKVRKIKHTIIRNRGKKSYTVIGGSTSEQLGELSGIRLIEPSRIRRSFVIRSRLKDQYFKQLHPSPIICSRRFRTKETSASPKSKQSDRHLKASEKFCSLSNLKKCSTNFYGTIENNVDTEVPSPVNAKNHSSNNYNVVSDDHSVAESEQITNIYDYSVEQEQLGV